MDGFVLNELMEFEMNFNFDCLIFGLVFNLKTI